MQSFERKLYLNQYVQLIPIYFKGNNSLYQMVVKYTFLNT